MFITKESDYGLRIIRALNDFTKKSVKDICQKEYIPQQYAYKILKKMEKGGIVTSYRGANGGYALAKPLEEISLYDIFSAVEDNVYFSECMDEDFNCPNDSRDRPCSIHIELNKIQTDLVTKLKEKNMADIMV